MTGSATANADVASMSIGAIVKQALLGGGPGPERLDAFARDDLIDWSGATAVYGCGTSAGGATVTCVDAQRPSSMRQADAVTMGHYVFCQGTCDSALLLAHEFVHVRQYEVSGDAMAVSYLLQTAVNGYRQNPYEVEAYNVGAYLKAQGWVAP